MAKMHIAHPDYPELVLCGRSRDFVRRNVVPMDWPHLEVNDCRTCLMRRESMRLRSERKPCLPNAQGQPAAAEPAKQAGRGPLGCADLSDADDRSEGKP